MRGTNLIFIGMMILTIMTSQVQSIKINKDNNNDNDNSIEVIKPRVSSLPIQTLSIFIGETQVPIESYRSLSSLLQSRAEVAGQSMWVSLCDQVSSTIDARNCLQESVSIAQTLGYSSGIENTVIVAHGDGSDLVQSVVSQQGYGALVQLGSYLRSITADSRGKQLLSYSKPILTLAGELDPFSRPNRITYEYKSFLQFVESVGLERGLTEKPVIVLPGVNHVQFANGYIDPRSIGVDNVADNSNEEALQEIGRVVSNFITLNFGNSTSGSLDEMIQDNKYTEGLLSSLIQLNNIDKCTYCLEAQKHIFNFSPQNSQRVTTTCNYHENLIQFSGNPTGLERVGENAAVLTQNLNYYPSNIGDELISQTIAPTQMNCKLKNQESVTNLLNFTETNPEPDCRSMNLKTLSLVESLLPSDTLKRYQSKGTQLRLIEDIQKRIGPGWLPSRLYFQPSDVAGYVDVASVALITSINSPGPEYWGGNHYCILLAPSFYAEWIISDSLPKV